MRKRRRSPQLDIIKVLICFLLLILVGLGTKVIIDQRKISQPAANAGGQLTNVTPKPESTKGGDAESTPTENAENIKLSKEKANVAPGKTLALKVKGTKQEVTWTSSDDTVASVEDNGTVTGIANGEATITAEVGEKKLECKITVKKVKQIAITFDDGPCQYTPEVLDILEKYNAHATFFVLGNRINDTTTKYLQREIKIGCEVGNHTYSHILMNGVDKATALADVNKGTEAITKAIGKKPILMRPPGGSITKGDRKQWIDDQYIIYWRLDTLDWKYPNTDRIVNLVLSDAQDGDIVLLHEIHKTTVDGVERIVKGLQEQGFELLTISELSEAKNEPLRKHRLIGSF